MQSGFYNCCDHPKTSFEKYWQKTREAIRKRIRERGLTRGDIAEKVAPKMGVGKSAVCTFIRREIYRSIIGIRGDRDLRRFAVLLEALGFEPDSEIIVGAKKFYGDKFEYPPQNGVRDVRTIVMSSEERRVARRLLEGGLYYQNQIQFRPNELDLGKQLVTRLGE